MIRRLLLTGIEQTDANQNTVLVACAFMLPPLIFGAMSLLRWLA